jgi:hypothetical protein
MHQATEVRNGELSARHEAGVIIMWPPVSMLEQGSIREPRDRWHDSAQSGS